VDQSKAVQARITKFLSSAAWKTLVSGTVKVFHKFEKGLPRTRALNERGWAKFAILGQQVVVSRSRCEIRPRLLLITNRKSYTGSRLAPNSMTLNDFERQNRGYYGFFWLFRAATQVYIIRKVAQRNYRYVIRIENLASVY